MKNCLYKIYLLCRDDGELYVGTTNNRCFSSRMRAHQKSKRFEGHSFDVKVLIESTNKNIHDLEEYYIDKFDTYESGLNESYNGKGPENFSTKGFKFSLESRLRMSLKKQGYQPWIKGKKHSIESKLKMSSVRKGKIHSFKVSKEKINHIRNLYEQKIPIIGVGKIQGNGKELTYARAFSRKFNGDYNLSDKGLYNIITGKCLR